MAKLGLLEALGWRVNLVVWHTDHHAGFTVSGTIPLGTLLGGFLGEKIGLWPTLLVGVLRISVAWLWVLFSPVRTLRQIPESQEAVSPQPPAERVGDAQASISP